MASTPDYTSKQKQYVQYLYEVEGLTLDKAAEQIGASHPTAKAWKKKGQWLAKGEKAPELEAFTRQKFLEIAEELGMGLKDAIKIQIKGMQEPMKTTFGRDGDCVTEEDYATRHKYVKDFWGLSGLLGGNKLEVNAADGAMVNIQIQHPGKE